MWQDQMVEVMMWWIQMLMSDAQCLDDVMRTKPRREWLRDAAKGCGIKWRLRDHFQGQSRSDFVNYDFGREYIDNNVE